MLFSIIRLHVRHQDAIKTHDIYVCVAGENRTHYITLPLSPSPSLYCSTVKNLNRNFSDFAFAHYSLWHNSSHIKSFLPSKRTFFACSFSFFTASLHTQRWNTYSFFLSFPAFTIDLSFFLRFSMLLRLFFYYCCVCVISEMRENRKHLSLCSQLFQKMPRLL